MILPRVRLSVWRPEGISFALTASVFWLSTGDRDAALQTAAVQAGKTFTRTLAVYVTTQQLHRLSVVQGMLKHIDFRLPARLSDWLFRRGLVQEISVP